MKWTKNFIVTSDTKAKEVLLSSIFPLFPNFYTLSIDDISTSNELQSLFDSQINLHIITIGGKALNWLDKCKKNWQHLALDEFLLIGSRKHRLNKDFQWDEELLADFIRAFFIKSKDIDFPGNKSYSYKYFHDYEIKDNSLVSQLLVPSESS